MGLGVQLGKTKKKNISSLFCFADVLRMAGLHYKFLLSNDVVNQLDDHMQSNVTRATVHSNKEITELDQTHEEQIYFYDSHIPSYSF